MQSKYHKRLLGVLIFGLGVCIVHNTILVYRTPTSSSPSEDALGDGNGPVHMGTKPTASSILHEEYPLYDLSQAARLNMNETQKRLQSLKEVFDFVPNGIKSCQNLFGGKPLRSVIPDVFMEDFKQFKEKALAICGGGRMESYSAMFEEAFMTYYLVARAPFVKTVCETGFNAGHSAFTWLRANPDIHVYSFDIGSHGYSVPISKHLEKSFPGRLNVTWGNSLETLPFFHRKYPSVTCDLLIVDGGHTRDVCQSDFDTFKHMANEPNILLFDNYPDDRKEWMSELGDMWEGGKRNGEIIEIFQCNYEPKRRQGFSVGRINANNIV